MESESSSSSGSESEMSGNESSESKSSPIVIEISDSSEIKRDEQGSYIEHGEEKIRIFTPPKYNMKYENEHAIPPPFRWGNMEGDTRMNEYVFNHLPLVETQKTALRDELRKEQLIKEKGEAREEALREELIKIQGERQKQKKEKAHNLKSRRNK